MTTSSRSCRLLAGLLVAMLLYACGGSGTDEAADDDEATEPATAAGADAPAEEATAEEATAEEADDAAEPSAASEADDASSEPTATEAVAATDLACDALTVGVLDDDPHRAMFHALEEGLTDADVELDVQFATIPALIEASQSGSFDIVEASSQIPVLARLGGIDMRVLAPAQLDGEMAQVLLAGADVTDPSELDGQTMAVVSLGSTTTVISQIVLGATYGLDPALEGGSLTWIELPFDQVASEIGRSAAAGAVSHYGQWLAMKDPELTALTNVGEDYRGVSGDVPFPLSVFMTTGPQLEGRGVCFDAARRAIDVSVAYAVEHAEEVATAVAATSSAPDQADVEVFLQAWLTEWMSFDVRGDEEGLTPVTTFWELGHEQGILPPPPAFEEIAVQGDE